MNRRGLIFAIAALMTATGCQLLSVIQGNIATPPTSCLQVTEQIQSTDSQPVTADVLEQTRTIIQNRVNTTGLARFAVRAQAPDRITVTFSGPVDASQIRALIGQTGKLEFIGVPTSFGGQVNEGAPLPPGMVASPIFAEGQVAEARPGTNQTGLPAVDLVLKSAAAAAFDQYAAANYGGQFAIVLDGIVQSAPTINAIHFNGELQITGTFDDAEVNRLVAVVSFGSLPLPVAEVSFSPVDCAVIGS